MNKEENLGLLLFQERKNIITSIIILHNICMRHWVGMFEVNRFLHCARKLMGNRIFHCVFGLMVVVGDRFFNCALGLHCVWRGLLAGSYFSRIWNITKIMRSLLFICCISSLGSANAAAMAGRSCCSPV